MSSDEAAAFVHALRRVTLRWRRLFDARLKQTPAQTYVRAQTLRLLATRPEGMTQRDLTEEQMTEHPTMVRILDALETQGLIRREPIEGNRRANLIRLTEAAAPVIAELEDMFAAERQRLLADIPPGDLALVTRVLGRIADKLE